MIARTAGEGRDIATTAFFGAVVVSLAVALAVGGLVVVQRLVPLSLRETHNAATGTIFAALYVLFGVTVGFSLLLVWQQYDAAEKVTAREAATVEELYRLAGDLPEPDRGRVQGLAESYARVVMEEEWPLMRDGGTSPRGGARRRFAREHPGLRASHGERAGTPQRGLDAAGQPGRGQGATAARGPRGSSPLMWVVLVVGVITVAFTYLFGLETLWLHALAVAALTVVVTLIFYTTAVLDYPFNGDLRVEPDAFELVLDRIG